MADDEGGDLSLSGQCEGTQELGDFVILLQLRENYVDIFYRMI